jgi:hypothetical protein
MRYVYLLLCFFNAHLFFITTELSIGFQVISQSCITLRNSSLNHPKKEIENSQQSVIRYVRVKYDSFAKSSLLLAARFVRLFQASMRQ